MPTHTRSNIYFQIHTNVPHSEMLAFSVIVIKLVLTLNFEDKPWALR